MASLGNINGKLWVSIGDGEPEEIAAISIPLTVRSGHFRGDIGAIQIEQEQLTANLAASLVAAAKKLTDES